MKKEICKFPYNGISDENREFLSDKICENIVIALDKSDRPFYILKGKVYNIMKKKQVKLY